MLTIIFRVILALVHSFYLVFETIKSRLTLARVIILSSNIWSPSEWRKSIPQKCQIRQNKEIRALKDSVDKINILPLHLCIVVGNEEQVSFHHLSRILRWCIITGIPWISFYDHNGFIKEKQNNLRSECERSMPKLASLVDWEPCPKKINNLGENNCIEGFRRTRVQVFSNEDGKGEIVNLAQKLSRAVAHGLLKMEEIDTELLNDKLRLENTPDPDVVFVCGPALSTYGLLPWHTRTTEFFNLRSHRHVSIDDFTCLLERYGACEQRYGK